MRPRYPAVSSRELSRHALVLTGLANFGVAGYSKAEPHRRRLTSFLESEILHLIDTNILIFALPAVRVRFSARFFCQGRTLRSRERKTRGLDSACGKAPGTATKGICFFFSSGSHARKKEERRNHMKERQHATWGELLREAVEKPGRMLEAYTAFHNYSFGNALLALEQCTRRNLQPGPLNTHREYLTLEKCSHLQFQ
jgi:hypothetical protein